MKTRRLGELEVSEIGMGCMGFSHGYGKIPERSYSIEAIQQAFDQGCTFFDTAEAYGSQLYYEGHNEEIVGEALEGKRAQVRIATKFHLKPADYAQGADLYEQVKGHLTRSLKRLRSDYADLYYLHRTDDHVPIEDVAEVMGRLIKEGLIRGWGLSQVDVDTLRRAHEVTPVTAVQSIYNIVERDSEKDVIPYCLQHNIGFVAFSPVASGLLSGKIKSDAEFEKTDDVRNWVPQLTPENIRGNQPIIDIIERLAAKKDATPAQISLAWMLRKYPNVVPIPGSKKKEHIRENLGAVNISFTDEEFDSFEKELDACKIYGHRGIVEAEGRSFLDKKPLR